MGSHEGNLPLRCFGGLELVATLGVLTGCPQPVPAPGPDPSLDGCSWGGDETGGDTGFGNDDELLVSAFGQYQEQHVVEGPNGQWLIEQDILTDDFALVRQAYQRYRQATREDSRATDRFRGTVACDQDLQIDQVWSPSRKLNLTYCFDSSWDQEPQLLPMATLAMERASGAWESTADVNFIAAPVSGEDCSHETALFTISNEGDSCLFGVLCSVRGLAFFPNEENEDERVLNLWNRAFDEGQDEIDFVVTHELGHILGLWHEHARFDQSPGICGASDMGDGRARGVTERDADSVMGYSSCAGTEPMPPHPSALDRTTLAYLYNLSRPILGGAAAPPDSGLLIWHRPETADYAVWTPFESSAQEILFAEDWGCYDPGCTTTDALYWKPLLFGNGAAADVLMYGPGVFEERRIMGIETTGGVSDVPGGIGTSVDVPLVLDGFFGPQQRGVWWIRPGHVADRLWRDLDGQVLSSDDFDERVFTDEHYSASVGRLLSNYNSVLWLSPTSTEAYLTRFTEGTLLQVAFQKTSCGLADGVYYDSIPGDYDADQTDEIVWYDYDAGEVVYWPQLPNCASPPTFRVGQGKVGKIRLGGLKDVLLVYQPRGQSVQLFDASFQSPIATLPITVDASPVLRDFDADGCTDILWFAPHLTTSLLWRSHCDGGFTETSLEHPPEAYPLGFGLGSGRI